MQGPGQTYTPATLIHATIAPGAEVTLPWRQDYNALVYALSGDGQVGSGAARRSLKSGQTAVFGSGDTITIAADPVQVGLRQAEVGCMLARSYWGQGLMGEALTAVMGYAGELGIHTLLADIEPGNLPSQRLFRRLGFVWQQGTLYRLERQEGIRRCPW